MDTIGGMKAAPHAPSEQFPRHGNEVFFRIYQQSVVIKSNIVYLKSILPKGNLIDYPLGGALTKPPGNLPRRTVIAPVGTSLGGYYTAIIETWVEIEGRKVQTA